MASLFEYADRHLGLSYRQAEERLRVGKALAALPSLDRAFAQGTLTFSHVRELTRVATAETEQAWLDWTLNRDGGGADDNDVARRRRLRDVEQAVARREPGHRPSDPGDPARDKHRLSFEVKAETIALFRDLQNSVREDLGHRVDDDTLLLEIARRALGAAGSDDGRAPYQVAVSKCDDCGQTRVDAAGQSHPVDEAFAAMADCDAQHLGDVDARPHVGEPPPPCPKRATQTIPPCLLYTSPSPRD